MENVVYTRHCILTRLKVANIADENFEDLVLFL